MSARHTEEHEALLERVVVGDLSAADPQVQRQLAECADCRERLAGLQALVGELAGAGELEREVLAEAAHRPAPSEGARTLRALVLGRAGRRPERPALRRIALAVSLAAGLVAAVFLYRAFVPAHTGDVLLGDDEIACDQPIGDVADFATFSWRFALPLRGRFELRVWDDSSPEASRPLAEQVDLTESRWNPEQDAAGWPRRIRWEVRAYDAGGQLLRRSELQRAWRSPH